jgi:hypothetical protein
MATGRAFEAGLISTATKAVENIFNSAHFCANWGGRLKFKILHAFP